LSGGWRKREQICFGSKTFIITFTYISSNSHHYVPQTLHIILLRIRFYYLCNSSL
uniref:Ovule protein n=1 Tax=Brugia timori TaxID=42155 RepID=A0A0R3RAH4_9BILA